MMVRAVGEENGFCTACYTNDYPIAFPRDKDNQIGLFDKER